MTFHILGIISPTDFHIFQRGRSTTNQLVIDEFRQTFTTVVYPRLLVDSNIDFRARACRDFMTKGSFFGSVRKSKRPTCRKDIVHEGVVPRYPKNNLLSACEPCLTRCISMIFIDIYPSKLGENSCCFDWFDPGTHNTHTQRAAKSMADRSVPL